MKKIVVLFVAVFAGILISLSLQSCVVYEDRGDRGYPRDEYRNGREGYSGDYRDDRREGREDDMDDRGDYRRDRDH